MMPILFMGRKNNILDKGFTLLEILVAIALISVVIGLVVSGMSSSRGNMEESLSNIERAIRFSVSESAIKNVITRVQFELDKDPQEYYVEYGPDDTFVLPPNELGIMGASEEGTQAGEEQTKRVKKINQAFNKVKEFSSSNLELPPDISIIGVGTSLSLKLVTNFFASIYVYPSGEKDGAIIILTSPDEVVALIVSPFSEDYDRFYREIKIVNEDDDMEEVRLKMAKELYEEWLKN